MEIDPPHHWHSPLRGSRCHPPSLNSHPKRSDAGKTLIVQIANPRDTEEAAPIHPGEVLREDFLIPLGLSEYRVAKDIGVPPRRINEIVKGRRAVTMDTALRLERYFGWPAEVWMNLQSHHDQQAAKESMKATLASIQPCPAL